VSGLTLVPPVDDEEFDEADWLVEALAFALAVDDALFLGVAEVLPEGEAATTACVGAGLVQVGFGVGWIVFLAVPFDVGLVLGLGLSDTVAVAVGVPLGLLLGLTLGLVLALAEALALALALAVLPPLWLPLDDVAGAVVSPVVLLAGLVLVAVAA
jgi:hypothetical protein